MHMKLVAVHLGTTTHAGSAAYTLIYYFGKTIT